MLRKSQDKNKKIGDCENVFQRANLDGIKVMYRRCHIRGATTYNGRIWKRCSAMIKALSQG